MTRLALDNTSDVWFNTSFTNLASPFLRTWSSREIRVLMAASMAKGKRGRRRRGKGTKETKEKKRKTRKSHSFCPHAFSQKQGTRLKCSRVEGRRQHEVQIWEACTDSDPHDMIFCHGKGWVWLWRRGVDQPSGLSKRWQESSWLRTLLCFCFCCSQNWMMPRQSQRSHCIA